MRPYYSAVRFLAGTLFGVLAGWRIRGAEGVPQSGGLILAANHISFWDPPIFGAAFPRELNFLAKQELFSTPLLGPLIQSLNSIPIRRGAADLAGLSRAIDLLKSGGALIMFPEGSRMRDGQLHPARPGVGLLAVHGDAMILPACITGSNQPGKWWYRGARVRVTFGTARPWRAFLGPDEEVVPGRAVYQRIGDGIMREIAALKSDQETSASLGAA